HLEPPRGRGRLAERLVDEGLRAELSFATEPLRTRGRTGTALELRFVFLAEAARGRLALLRGLFAHLDVALGEIGPDGAHQGLDGVVGVDAPDALIALIHDVHEPTGIERGGDGQIEHRLDRGPALAAEVAASGAAQVL